MSARRLRLRGCRGLEARDVDARGQRGLQLADAGGRAFDLDREAVRDDHAVLAAVAGRIPALVDHAAAVAIRLLVAALPLALFLDVRPGREPEQALGATRVVDLEPQAPARAVPRA